MLAILRGKVMLGEESDSSLTRAMLVDGAILRDEFNARRWE